MAAQQDDYLLRFLLEARDNASHVVEGFGGRVKTAAHDAQIAIGAIGLAALGATTAAVKMAEDFDVPMRKVYALTGINKDQFESYKQSVLDLSTVVPKSATDLANGLYYVVSAGFQGSDAMDILKSSAEAASAGLTDTKTVADAVTSALNAYKLTGADSAHVTDLITQAVTQGKTEYGALAGSIGRVLPIASNLGVGLDEVLASMSTMTRVGMNADEAATALRSTLTALTRVTPAAAKEMAKLGVSAAGLRDEIRTKGLLATLQDLMDKTHGNVDELVKLFPNVRALTGVLATAGSQGAAYAKILGSMKDATGLTDEAFKRTSAGLAVQTSLLKNNIQAIGITIGEALLPSLVQITGAIASVVTQVREWMKENPQLADMAAKGLALVAVFGTLAGGAATLGAAIGFVGTHLGGLFLGISTMSHGLLAVLGPIGLVIAAVLALKLAWDANLFDIQGRVGAAMPQIRAAFQAVSSTVSDVAHRVGIFLHDMWMYISPFVEKAVATLGRFWNEVQPKLEAAWNAISTAVRFAVENYLMPLIDALGEFWTTHWTTIVEVLTDTWNVITDVIRVAWDLISGIFKIALDAISGNWQGVWDDLGTMVHDVLSDLGRFLHDYLLNLVPTVFGLAKDLAGAIAEGLIQGLGNAKTAVGNAIGTLAGSMLDGIKGFFGISSPSAVMAGVGGDITLGLASGITGGTGAVTGAVGSLAQQLGLSLNSGLTTAMQNAQATLQSQIAQLLRTVANTAVVPSSGISNTGVPLGQPGAGFPVANIGGVLTPVAAQAGSVLQKIGSTIYGLSAAAIARGGIPGYAGGGMVERTGLIYAHAGERVQTPEQQRAGDSRPIVLTLDGKVLAEVLGGVVVKRSRIMGRALGG